MAAFLSELNYSLDSLLALEVEGNASERGNVAKKVMQESVSSL